MDGNIHEIKVKLAYFSGINIHYFIYYNVGSELSPT